MNLTVRIENEENMQRKAKDWGCGRRTVSVGSLCRGVVSAYIQMLKLWLILSILSASVLGSGEGLTIFMGLRHWSPWHDCAHVSNIHSLGASCTPTEWSIF